MAHRLGRRADLLGLVGWLALSLAAGVVGSIATAEATRTWYPTLERPAFTPPAWVFGPAWTLLYILMGVAAWRVWRTLGFAGARGGLGLFLVQLAVNAAWSFTFFHFRLPGWAFVHIVVLWVLIVATVMAFWRHDRSAALLLVPYLAWVSFASVLNFEIWRLN